MARSDDARGRPPSSAPIFGVPRVPSVCVSRARLLARLDSRPALTIVRGPAGSGKSALLADWARSRTDAAGPGVWLTLDDSTRDRRAFWRVAVDTLEQAGLIDNRRVAAFEFSARNSLEALRSSLGRIFRSVPSGITLVIDSFDRVDEPEIADDLLWVLHHCPGVQLVVATRTLGPFESTQTLLAFDTTVIAGADLLMLPSETADALRAGGVAQHGELVDVVHAITGGLPLAVGVAILVLRDSRRKTVSALRAALPALVGAHLRELMVAEVLSPRLISFAARTAVAEVLSVELAAELSGFPDAVELLELAEREGLGGWESGSHERVFRYTPAARAAFLAEVIERYPQERARLWRIAAEWYAAHDRVLDGFRLALEIDDLDLASRLARGSWLDRSSTAEMRAFVEIFAHVPLRRLGRHPLLLMALAMGYNRSGIHRIRAVELFGLAVVAARLRGPRADPAERLLLFGMETAALRVSGRTDAAVRTAERGWQFVQQLGPELVDELRDVFGIAANHIGLTFLVAGRIDEARDAFSAVYSFPYDEGARSWFHALALLAGTHAIEGDLVVAQQIVDEGDRLDWPPLWRDGYIGSFYRLARATLAIERFDFETAEAELEVLAPHLATIEHWPMFTQAKAMIDLGTGNASSGIARLEAELVRSPRPPVSRYLRMRMAATNALLLLAAGRHPAAGAALSPHTVADSPVAAILALRELLDGRPQVALSRVDDRGGNTPMHRHEAHLCVIGAAAALRLGRREDARDRVDALADLMQRTGLRSPLMLIPRSDLEALRALALEREGAQTSAVFVGDEDIPDLFPESVPSVLLSARETEVLGHLMSPMTSAAIAKVLYLSPNTVKAHVFSIYRKLGVNSREEAVRVATERGLRGH